MRYPILLLTILLSAAPGTGAAEVDTPPLLMQHPTLSTTRIAFSYAGDLWTVSRTGGEAIRLTTGVGAEIDPYFSPDGRLLAFTGEYDGNIDVYVVPASGGVPRRLTYHPGVDRAAGWTPDGKQVLFVSGRNSYSNRFGRLFTMPLDGASAAEVPLPMGYEGAYSPDGTQLAYVPVARAFRAWKRYRGGMTTPIWVARLTDSSVERIPRENSNDFNPIWAGNRVFFLSDRNGPVTLFSYDTATKKVTQLIRNAGLDIKSAGAGPDAIVYEQFGSLSLYDLKSGRTTALHVTIKGDLGSVRPRFEKAADGLVNAELSPAGARAVFETRGEILTVPAEKGDTRNLTNTPGVAERDPSWSPDGKSLAYFSDESGEYALHIRDQSGLGEVRKIGLGAPPSFFYSPAWSPDSRKIAYFDKRLNLWYVDLDKPLPIKVDTTLAGASTLNPDWSPDSRWLAYTKTLKSWLRAVFVYSLEEGKSHQVTDGLSDARFPLFDKGGKYIYFSASTDTANTSAGLDMSRFPLRPTRSLYLVVLDKQLKSPLAPESDEEKGDEKPAGQDGGKKADAPAAGPKKEPAGS